MKNSYRIILYIFILILIISGISLLIFHDQALVFFESNTDAAVAALSAETPAPSSRPSDLNATLESPRFKELVNNVVNFNFDNICWRPGAVISRVATDENADTASTTSPAPAALNCSTGNNNPFIVNVKTASQVEAKANPQ